MTRPRAYFDWNASAPLLPAARAAMIAALDAANPSSVHAEGRAARRIVEEARAAVAALAGGRPEHVIFTSGATEAATTLLSLDWRLGRAPLRMSRLYTSMADHPCFLSGGRFGPGEVVRIRVDRNGVLDCAELDRALDLHDKECGLPLVALHAANNETGVIQPIVEIAAIVRRHGGVLALDAVQTAGRLALDLATLDFDFLILSGHKLGAPKGVGAIIAKSDLMMPAPLIAGGGQERGHRAGTENLAGIAGFGAAARHAKGGLDHVSDIRNGRDRIEKIILNGAPDAEIFGAAVERLPNTTFFAVPGLRAETMQIVFDLAGFAVSAGSACSSGKVGPSHVLKAMGVEGADGAIRVSIGETNTSAEIDRFEAVFGSIIARRKPMPGIASRAA